MKKGMILKRDGTPYKTRAAAIKAAPWAAKVIKVEGGYMGFESITDYKVWEKQK